ncbi:MAG: PadR family transcriptional regulator [Thermoplasmata archaeon]
MGPKGHHSGFGLRYLVLSIARKQPSTGAMIMDSLERMTLGQWRPSPGHIYPLLEEMRNEGLLNMEMKDGKKLYTPTDKGNEVLDSSWFPWRITPGLSSFSTYQEALRNVEILVDYLVDSKEEVAGDTEAKNRIKSLIERLSSI